MLQTRPLRPQDLHAKVHKPTVPHSACRRCRARYPHKVPRPEDVPEALRGLPSEVAHALRSVTINVGPETRADQGYRKKVRMITFSWALDKVDDKIQTLPKALRRPAHCSQAPASVAGQPLWSLLQSTLLVFRPLRRQANCRGSPSTTQIHRRAWSGECPVATFVLGREYVRVLRETPPAASCR